MSQEGAGLPAAPDAPLVAGGGLKIGYDVLLYRKFRGIKPPEESGGAGVESS